MTRSFRAFVALVVLVPVGCAGMMKPVDTLRSVPKAAESKELEALEGELRAQHAKRFPERHVITIYPSERDWTPRRHPRTGVLLGREAEFVVGAKGPEGCTYEIFYANQDAMGSAWTKTDLRRPAGPAGERELVKHVDCKEVIASK